MARKSKSGIENLVEVERAFFWQADRYGLSMHREISRCLNHRLAS